MGINKFANEIPESIRRAIRGLDNDYRAAIVALLYKHNELSFSDLVKKMKIEKAELYYHLKELTKSGLIKHYYKNELGSEKYSFYSITSFGKNFFEKLNETLVPMLSEKQWKTRLDIVLMCINFQIQRLNKLQRSLYQKDKMIFKKIVDAYSRHDMKNAQALANKLAKIRRIETTIMQATLALEKIALRLHKVSDLESAILTLGPAMNILHTFKKSEIVDLIPDLEEEIAAIANVLGELVMFTGATEFEKAKEDAQKILSEVEAVAQQKIEEKLPKLPFS